MISLLVIPLSNLEGPSSGHISSTNLRIAHTLLRGHATSQHERQGYSRHISQSLHWHSKIVQPAPKVEIETDKGNAPELVGVTVRSKWAHSYGARDCQLRGGVSHGQG